jgi:hypothetical protein
MGGHSGQIEPKLAPLIISDRLKHFLFYKKKRGKETFLSLAPFTQRAFQWWDRVKIYIVGKFRLLESMSLL